MLEALADPERADSVDPATYSFKLFVQMETGDRRYEGLNTGMWVGSGMRKGAQGELVFRLRGKICVMG